MELIMISKIKKLFLFCG
uniref:Uncharacterized protein n=1 Tax=Arundo donax TaxID=35708 RepID=A0A0A9B020_ARUDO